MALVHEAKITPGPGNTYNVTFDGKHHGHILRRKSWPLKRYVDEAMKQGGHTPAYDMTYVWDLT